MLPRYVAERMKAGISKAELKEELLAVGWSEEEADAAYRDGVIALGAPVPHAGNRPTLSRKSSAADMAVNLFSFILLAIVSIALGTLYFEIINRLFPDSLDSMNWYGEAASTSAIHYSIAALLIGFPLYWFSMRIWFRKFREDEGRIESNLSRWLTYLVFLIASVTIVGDLITLVFTFLQGEITIRFFLKALTILVIAGIIFGFYFFERKKIQYKREVPRTVFRNFGWVVTALVTLGIVIGLFAGGSPETTRQRTFDMERANHLSALSNCVEGYARDLGQLPLSLNDLRRSSQYTYCAEFMHDPETNEQYGYRVVTPARVEGAGRVGEFELCAAFALVSEASSAPENAQYPSGASHALWNEHGAGRDCDTVVTQLGTIAPTAPLNAMEKVPQNPAPSIP